MNQAEIDQLIVEERLAMIRRKAAELDCSHKTAQYVLTLEWSLNQLQKKVDSLMKEIRGCPL